MNAVAAMYLAIRAEPSGRPKVTLARTGDHSRWLTAR